MSQQPQTKRLKGTPLWNISKKFNFAAEKIIPDSFVFCVILMIVVFVLSLIFTDNSVILPGVLVTIAWLAVLWGLSRFWYERKGAQTV